MVRVFSYLRGTTNLGVLFARQSEHLQTYVDADHAEDSFRRSTTGFLILHHGNLVGWVSRLQGCIINTDLNGENERFPTVFHSNGLNYFSR